LTTVSCSRNVYLLPTNKGSDIINRKGEIIYSADFEILDFYNGLAEFDDTIRHKHGCIKKNGKIAFLNDDRFIQFYEGLACINRNDTVCFINKKGKVLIKPNYKGINLHGAFYNWSYYSEGMAHMVLPITDSSYRSVFIDKKGKVPFDKQYLKAGDFSNGLAAVQFLDSTVGYIDKKGRVKINIPNGQYGAPFSEGLAWVNESEWKPEGGSSYFINKDGKRIGKEKFLRAEHFQNGRAKIFNKMNDSYGFINRRGETVIEPKYRAAFNFSNGLASVEMEMKGEYGDFETYIINKKGDIVLGPYKNISIREFVNGVAPGKTRTLGDSCVEYFFINKKEE